MRRAATFVAGFIAGIVACYIAAVATVWRHFTHTRGAR